MKRTTTLKRSPMKRGTSTLKRATPMKAKAAPKFKRRTPAKTTEETRYLGRAAALGCMLCRFLGLGQTPAEMHHPRTGTGAGARAAHKDAFPLCPEHHRGNTGVHGLGRKAFDARYGITELDLRDMTHRLLGMV